MKKLKFENVLYKFYTLNEDEIEREVNNHKSSNPFYVPSLKYEIEYKKITVIDSYKTEYNNGYNGDITHYLFTDGERYYVCFIKDDELLSIPSFGQVKIKTGYFKTEDKLCAHNSSIKVFKNESEAYERFNKIKLFIIKSDELIKDNEKNCGLFFKILKLKLHKYGKLRGYYHNNHDVELYFKDVLVFVGDKDDSYFGADVGWIHNGAWVKDTFDFVEKYLQNQKESEQTIEKKKKDRILKVLASY